MKQGFGFFFTVAVAALVAWSVVHFGAGPAQTQASTQPVYDRVMQSKTLRCGYVVYPPTILKDPNTGVISGIMHDVIEAAAAKIGLKVEWTEELNWGNFMTGLDYDTPI